MASIPTESLLLTTVNIIEPCILLKHAIRVTFSEYKAYQNIRLIFIEMDFFPRFCLSFSRKRADF